jgi:hypothetical protein
MMKKNLSLPVVLLALFCLNANAQVADNDMPTQQVEEEVTTPPAVVPPSENKSKAIDLLNFGLRIDSALSEGGPTDQGFSIPSIRLTAFGDVTDNFNYRLSFGQTREFSSAQLPQILPVEAYADYISAKRGDTESSRLDWKAGMFTPSFNPWWTPDLTDIAMPDYLDSHRAMFISRDIGTEVSYEFKPEGFKAGVGLFNGNGIVALNSNNSKAFTAFLRETIPMGDASLEIGASAYGLFQATSGSINYIQNEVGDFYLDLNINSIGLNVMADAFAGNFQNSINVYNPVGGSASVSLDLLDWLKVFGRFETLSQDPANSGLTLLHFQVGPILKIVDQFTVYSFYEYYDHGDGNIENSFQIRARLII